MGVTPSEVKSDGSAWQMGMGQGGCQVNRDGSAWQVGMRQGGLVREEI